MEDPALFTPWQRRVVSNALVALAILFFIILTAAGLWAIVDVLGKLQAVLVPVAIAALMAYLLMPAVEWLVTKVHCSRSGAIWIVFLVGAVGALIVGLIAIPKMAQELSDFSQKLPKYFQNSVSFASGAIEKMRLDEMPEGQKKLIDELIARAKASLPDITKDASQKLWGVATGAFGWLGAIFGFLIIPVYVYFFLKDTDFFASNWKFYVPIAHTKVRQDVIHLIEEIDTQIKAFFRGQCLVAAFVGGLSAIGFFIVGIDFALLLGIWVGMFDLIPFFGIIAAAVPSTLLGYAQYGDWQHPLAAIGVCGAVHLAENLLIAPKIVGSKTGLHPVAVLLSILVWGKLLGFMGILLAVPLTSTLKVLFRHYLWERLSRKA